MKGPTSLMEFVRDDGTEALIEYNRENYCAGSYFEPPDGWHYRNGYINRQAVECFVHHPYDGQDGRFTVWF